jgi:hypothetical protein
MWIVGKLKLSDYIMAVALVTEPPDGFQSHDTDLLKLCTWGLCACNHYQLLFGSGAQSMEKQVPTVSFRVHASGDSTLTYIL